MSEPAGRAGPARPSERKTLSGDEATAALVTAPTTAVDRAAPLHERSLRRAEQALSRWINPEGGTAWRRQLGLAPYRPHLSIPSAVVLWPGRPAAWGTAYDHLVALDPLTGDDRWEWAIDDLATGTRDTVEPGGQAAVAVGDHIVVALDGGSGPSTIDVAALDGRSGTPIWRTTVPGTLDGPVAAPRPDVVVLSHVVAGTRTGANRVTALDSRTGERRWSRDHPQPGESGRVPSHGDLIVPLLGDWEGVREIWSCDPATGAPAWFRTPHQLLGQAAPTDSESRVWARAVAGPGVVVLTCLVDNFPTAGRWPVSEAVLSELDLATGFVRWNVRWHRKLGDVIAVDADLVVVHHGDGFEAIDRATGQHRWSQPAPIDTYFHKPVLAGGVLLHRDRADIVIRDRARGAVLWRHEVGLEPSPANIDAPSVLGSRVFCRVDGDMVAVDLPQPLRRAIAG